MNGKDLLKGMGNISPKYYEEAENATIAPAHKKIRKPLLAAAMIAMSLLLAGCAAVVLMKMQDLKVGEQEVTNPVYNEYMEFQGVETVAQQVLNLAGVQGSSSYQAAREWFDFKNTYDPDHAILDSVWGNKPEYDHKYDAYGPYSKEMEAKLDEIAAKYDLNLHGPLVKLHGGKRFYEEMGMNSILMPDAKAEVEIKAAHAYENGSWYVDFFKMQMPEEEGQWPYQMTNWMSYIKKDCFSTDLVALDDHGDWVEWNYKTASGRNVLMMMSKSDYAGWIICDRADAMIAVRVEVRNDVGYNEEGKSWFDSTYMSNKQFEKVADAIDFNMRPEYQGESVSNVDTTVLSQTNNGYTIAVKDVQTDGYAAVITLGITAPEGVILKDPEHNDYHLINGNWGGGEYLYAEGKHRWEGSATCDTLFDEDKTNTCEMKFLVRPHELNDSAAPITADTVYNLYFEDLRGSWWDDELCQQMEETVAEGVWHFQITFKNADFREIEMVAEPVNAQAEVGWSAKTGDIYEDVEITSFKLRSLGATITHTGGNKGLTGGPGHQIFVVMKDGTEVEIFGFNGQTYKFHPSAPIDLDQVDHIRLPDGTKLPAPDPQ